MELLKRVAAGLPSTEHLQFEAQTVGSPSETSIVWPVHHTFARAGDKALYQIRFGPAHNVWMRDGRLARKYIKQWKQYTEDAIDTANGQGILQALKEADHGFAGRFRMLPMLSADVSAIRDQEIKTRYRRYRCSMVKILPHENRPTWIEVLWIAEESDTARVVRSQMTRYDDAAKTTSIQTTTWDRLDALNRPSPASLAFTMPSNARLVESFRPPPGPPAALVRVQRSTSDRLINSNRCSKQR